MPPKEIQSKRSQGTDPKEMQCFPQSPHLCAPFLLPLLSWQIIPQGFLLLPLLVQSLSL